MGNTSKGFDFGAVTKVLVALLLLFMGISGFISTRGTDYTKPVFDIFDEDAITYILCGILSLSGVGMLLPMFMKGLPSSIEGACKIVALVFWVVVIVFKDIIPLFDGLDAEDFIEWIQVFAVDFILLMAVVQVSGKGGSSAK